jgi:hypothetical protein
VTEGKEQAFLLKFGKRVYLEDFRNGILHMNSQRYFSTLEQDAVRGDPYEGTDQIHQPRDIQVVHIIDNVTGTEMVLRPDDFAGPLLVGFGRESYTLFCMHAITEPPDSKRPLLDSRNLTFGDSFVGVLHTQEFINRISAVIKSSGMGGKSRLVEYYNIDQHSGDTGPFRKPSTFRYQQEFRIAVFPGSSEPIRLSVGSLEDITTPVFPLADIDCIISCGEKP